jgi:Tol biopolymer transport system component
MAVPATPTAGSLTTPLTQHEPDGDPVEDDIAFLLDGNVWLLDSRTGARRQLTEGGTAGDVAWSPGGRQLVVSSSMAGGRIYTLRPDGSAMSVLVEDPGPTGYPAYAPDGTLYFVRRGASEEPPGIEIVRYDGPDEQSVVHRVPGGLCGPGGLDVGREGRFALMLVCGRGRHVLLGAVQQEDAIDLAESYPFNDAGCAYDARWARDGLRLAVLASIDCTPGLNSQLWLVDVDSPAETPVLLYSGAGAGGLAWMPDDSAIVFDSFSPTGEPDGLWLLDLTGLEPRQISGAGMRPATPLKHQ